MISVKFSQNIPISSPEGSISAMIAVVQRWQLTSYKVSLVYKVAWYIFSIIIFFNKTVGL